MNAEPNVILSHAESIVEVVKMCQRLGGRVDYEVTLPDGKVADVLWEDHLGDIFIFEVKTTFKPSLRNEAYGKYFRWANYLWLVVPGLVIADFQRYYDAAGWRDASAAVGMMGVYPCSTAVIHPAAFHHLVGEKRLAVLGLLPRP